MDMAHYRFDPVDHVYTIISQYILQQEKLPVFVKTRGVHCLFRSRILGGFRGDQNAGKPA